MIGPGRELNVFRNIDDDRPWTTCGRDQKGLVDCPREIIDIGDEIIVLGAASRDPDRVALLERVRADQMRRHLPGNDDHGNGIHHRVGDRRHHIRRARAGGHQSATPAFPVERA